MLLAEIAYCLVVPALAYVEYDGLASRNLDCVLHTMAENGPCETRTKHCHGPDWLHLRPQFGILLTAVIPAQGDCRAT
jgi:hypothetical protein